MDAGIPWRHGRKNSGSECPEASQVAMDKAMSRDIQSPREQNLDQSTAIHSVQLGVEWTRLASHDQVNERRGQEGDPSEEAGN